MTLGPAAAEPQAAAAEVQVAQQNIAIVPAQESAVVLRSAEERVTELQNLGLVSRTQQVHVDGHIMSANEVLGVSPSIWDLPEASQLERLANCKANIPGVDSSVAARKNPSWMGCLWDANTSLEPHESAIMTTKPQGEKLQ